MAPRRRHQRRQPLDELQRLHHHRRRSVSPRAAQRHPHATVGHLLQSIRRQRRIRARLGRLDEAVLLWYAIGMSSTKRKVSVSLDATLVAELEAGEESLSAQVNTAVKAEFERRRRQRLLTELLDRLDAEQGPVPEALIAKYMRLLE